MVAVQEVALMVQSNMHGSKQSKQRLLVSYFSIIGLRTRCHKGTTLKMDKIARIVVQMLNLVFRVTSGVVHRKKV